MRVTLFVCYVFLFLVLYRRSSGCCLGVVKLIQVGSKQHRRPHLKGTALDRFKNDACILITTIELMHTCRIVHPQSSIYE